MTLEDRPICSLSFGSFGRAVIAYLKKMRNDCVDADGPAVEGETLIDARTYVVASWRPVASICKKLNEISHQRSVPLLPVIVDGKILYIGPVIVPGSGPCWECWIRRKRQHDRYAAMHLAIEDFYVNQPDAGPVGYLEPFAHLAAAHLSDIIGSLDDKTATAGQVWRMDMITRDLSCNMVTGVHGCRWCGIKPKLGVEDVSDLKIAVNNFLNL